MINANNTRLDGFIGTKTNNFLFVRKLIGHDRHRRIKIWEKSAIIFYYQFTWDFLLSTFVQLVSHLSSKLQRNYSLGTGLLELCERGSSLNCCYSDIQGNLNSQTDKINGSRVCSELHLIWLSLGRTSLRKACMRGYLLYIFVSH